jgi:threonine 3-dehydrogenase
VLVRVKAASICGTDLHIYGWDHWSAKRVKPPVTIGHEFCGMVEREGKEVTQVKAGDFVSAEMHVSCGHRHQCRMGQTHICQKVRVLGIDQDGAFAEFVLIPASNIWKLLKTLLGEAVLFPMHAVRWGTRLAQIRLASRVGL